MSAAALTQFLIDITRGHRKEAFAADPANVVAASTLSTRVRTAVLEQDIATLWLADAHPMALMYFARASGWANERYYRCIADAELTKAGPAGAAPTAEPEPSRTHRSSAPHAP
ncbi:MAG: hypothetical protein K8R60_10820 [Burkholderiales bacterium]|nr:hypothetical protein [Burkholderiales bacterium]